MKNNDEPRTVEVSLHELEILKECPECKDILIETINSPTLDTKHVPKMRKTSWEWEW